MSVNEVLNEMFFSERKSDMITLKIRDNLHDFNRDEGPGITSGMLKMGGQEFETERSEWENKNKSVRAKGANWLKKWLEEPNNLLNQGEEI